MRRRVSRPRLAVSDVGALYAAPRQPWLLLQRSATEHLATLDFRALVELGRRAAVIQPPAEPLREEH
jgi:hypothetical protein